MAEYFSIKISNAPWENITVDEIIDVSKQLAEYIPVVFTTMGPEGLLVTRKGNATDVFYNFTNNSSYEVNNSMACNEIESRIYPPLLNIDDNINKGYSVSGCGDCLAAGIISGMLKGYDELSSVSLGLRAAAISLQSFETTPATLKSLKS
ncbi:hypothetical protein PV327_005935 [Microctonus hyperodae]|uniref:Carbohydrate kinase PfkB domain-containing protein n=1 Tax=Microctonus hyperodae TaxID=165561 RepID=A0AA39G3V4_MICHY|nr:hypothetical protein PV327_005935 [Microctonus hyperodae]